MPPARRTDMTDFRSPRLVILGAGVLLATALTLAGCASPSPSSDTGIPSDSSSDTATDGGNSVGSESTQLPDGFPSDKVPLIDGTILNATHAGNIWAVWIASSDLPGDMAKATQLLVDAGYENVIAGTEYSDFHGSEYQVHVTAKDDPTWGPSVAYSFYAIGG